MFHLCLDIKVKNHYRPVSGITTHGQKTVLCFYHSTKYEVKPIEQALLDKGEQSRLSFVDGGLILTT